MPNKTSLRPTLMGACSVLIWGSALPIVRLVEEQIGLLAFMGLTYALIAGFGALALLVRQKPLQKGIFRSQLFYARWFFFVLHEGLLTAGVALVQRRHLPFLILINYLWPTAVIVCSVLLTVVTITRWWAFLLGLAVVVFSLASEILGSTGWTADLLSRPEDRWAYLMVFIGALAWGMYSALSRKGGDRSGGGAVLPLFQGTLALALPVALLARRPFWTSAAPTTLWLLVPYCLLLCLSYAAWDLGMRQGNVVVLSLLADLIPWVSLATTAFLLHIPLGARAIGSAVVLVVGAATARYGTLSRTPVIAAYDEPGI